MGYLEGKRGDAVLRAFAYCFADGAWHRQIRVLFKFMTWDEATLLCYLLNHSHKCGKTCEWFFCRVSTVCNELYCSEYIQNRLIRSLEARGYIKIRKEGLPPKRYIWINVEMIARRVQEGMEAEQEKRMGMKPPENHDDETFDD